MQEWFGYCLLPSAAMQQAMFWEGGGSNGKSVLIEIMRQFIGPYNCSAVPLGCLSKRFQALPTVGKLINFCTDTGELDKFGEGMIKAFIAGDIQYADVKNKKGIEYLPTARLIVAYNDRPRFFDKTDGMWRRMIVLSFPNRVKEKDKIHAFTDGGSQDWPFRPELPAILQWALRGLVRLLERRRFDLPECCTVAADEYREEANPIAQFIEERCDCAQGNKIARKTLYVDYSTYCTTFGFSPLGVILFKRELERYLVKRKKPFALMRPDKGAWHFTGITLKGNTKMSGRAKSPGLGRVVAEMRSKTKTTKNTNGDGG